MIELISIKKIKNLKSELPFLTFHYFTYFISLWKEEVALETNQISRHQGHRKITDYIGEKNQ